MTIYCLYITVKLIIYKAELKTWNVFYIKNYIFLNAFTNDIPTKRLLGGKNIKYLVNVIILKYSYLMLH